MTDPIEAAARAFMDGARLGMSMVNLEPENQHLVMMRARKEAQSYARAVVSARPDRADLIRQLNAAADEQSSMSPAWYPGGLEQEPHYKLAALLRKAAKALEGK